MEPTTDRLIFEEFFKAVKPLFPRLAWGTLDAKHDAAYLIFRDIFDRNMANKVTEGK